MIACGSIDTKAREGNHTRKTEPATSLRNAPQTTPPRTGATYESTRIAATMDLDRMITCGSLNAEEMEGNKNKTNRAHNLS